MTDFSTNVPTQLGPTREAAAALAPQRIDYDVEGAVRAGLRAPEIAEYLSSQTNYDYRGARDAGISDDEIIAELSTARMPSVPATLAEGAFRGALEGAPAIAGGITGATTGLQLGTAVAPALGPLAPAGPAIGFVLGGSLGTAAGLFAGQEAEAGLEGMGALPDTPVTPGRRPIFEGARTFGSGLPALPAPFLAVRGQHPGTMRFFELRNRRMRKENPELTPLDQILRSAQQRPGTFATGEAVALGAAATGGGLAEASDPGNALLRMGAELAFGVASPINATRVGGKAVESTREALTNLSPEGRANRLGQRLVRILEDEGEDVGMLMRRILDDDELDVLAREAGVDLGLRTPAAKTGSPTLAALQRTIAAENQQLGPTVQRAAEQNLAGVARLIDLMVAMDDPAILSTVAQMRDTYFRDALQMRLDQASAKAAETAGRILVEDPNASQRASLAVQGVLTDAISDARAQERALYGAVDLSAPADATNTASTLAEIRAELLPESPFPSMITRFVNRVTDEDPETGELLSPPSLRDLVNFRSEMLSMARDAQGTGNYRDARFYGRMAEGALEDIGLRAEALPGGIDPNIPMMRSPNERALENAYAFSRELNDVFTRSFAGDALARNRRGADRIPPELLANRILGGSGDATSLRIAQLEEAATFMANRAGPEFADTARDRLGTLRDAADTILRVSAARTVNPETGQVNPLALSRFIQNNGATLEQFPALRADLEDAVTAQQLLRNVTDANSVEARALDNSRIFRALLGSEEVPGGAVAMAIGTPGVTPDPNAVKNLNQLIRLVNGAGDLAPQAQAGLRDAVLDRALVYSTRDDGSVDFGRFRQFVLDPISRNQPSVGQVLREGGIFSDVELTQLNRFMREVEQIQAAVDAGGPRLEQTLVDAPAAALDMVLRVGGSALGTGVSRTMETVLPFYRRGGGQGLIEAQAGSAMTRNLFQDMPRTYFKDLVNEAIKDQDVMADILRRGTQQNMRARSQVDRRINSFLVASGLQLPSDQIEELRQQIPVGGFITPAAAATMPDPAELEAYLQSIAPPQAAPAPAAPALPPPQQSAAPQGAPPSPVPSSLRPAAGAQSTPGPQGGGMSTSPNYSALFPNDPIAPMMQQREMEQGIGSLMGAR
jgi:hypothetical protein